MAIEIPTLINGVEYGWSSLVTTIAGVPVTGIRAIKYKSKQEKKNVYGAGSKPVARSYGRIEYEASIALLSATVMAIKNGVRGKRLTNIAPFAITIMYQPDNGVLVTEILKNCEFLEDGFDWKEGDTEKEVELPLLISNIITK